MKNLILLHGALGSAEQMNPIAVELEAHFKVHILEFEGHGKSAGASSDFSIPNFSDQLNQYIENNKMEHPYVFGYSMGGYVALYHNVNHPQSIKKIACLATKFDWNPESAKRESDLLHPLGILEKFPGFAKLLQQRHGTHWNLVLEKTGRMMLELGKHPLLNSATLPTIASQNLLLLGDKDHMVSKEESIWAADLLMNARLEILENTIHPIEKINTSLLKSVLLKFYH